MGENAKYTPVEGFFVVVLGGMMGALALAIIAITTFPLAMLAAWIRWLLWGWFAVPYLHLPLVPYWAILGLGLLIGSFSHSAAPNGYKPTTKEQVNSFIAPILCNFALLGIGYLVHHYLLH